MFAKFANVNCHLISTDTVQFTASKILEKINSVFPRNFNTGKYENCQIVYDFLINKYDGKLRIYVDELEDISIYNSNCHKRSFCGRFTEVRKGEYIVIRKKNNILVTVITNVQQSTGKILYYGPVKSMPNCYKVFN